MKSPVTSKAKLTGLYRATASTMASSSFCGRMDRWTGVPSPPHSRLRLLTPRSVGGAGPGRADDPEGGEVGGGEPFLSKGRLSHPGGPFRITHLDTSLLRWVKHFTDSLQPGRDQTGWFCRPPAARGPRFPTLVSDQNAAATGRQPPLTADVGGVWGPHSLNAGRAWSHWGFCLAPRSLLPALAP